MINIDESSSPETPQKPVKIRKRRTPTKETPKHYALRIATEQERAVSEVRRRNEKRIKEIADKEQPQEEIPKVKMTRSPIKGDERFERETKDLTFEGNVKVEKDRVIFSKVTDAHNTAEKYIPEDAKGSKAIHLAKRVKTENKTARVFPSFAEKRLFESPFLR